MRSCYEVMSDRYAGVLRLNSDGAPLLLLRTRHQLGIGDFPRQRIRMP
jgi:hypothetical protein